MAGAIFNRVKMSVSGTPGTGTITLGSAVSPYQTFAAAGATNGQVVNYVIEDGTNWEYGTGTYTTVGTTLSRSPIASTNSNAAISATSAAVVFSDTFAADITIKSGDTLTGALNWATAPTIASAATVNIGAAASNYVKISGTTTITAFDTIAQGAERLILFTGALQVTNSANIVLPGARSVVTTGGDLMRVVSEGSGVWRCINWLPYSGTRELLTADRSYYVRTDGSDSNNGLANTAAGAFLTLQGAWNKICATIDAGGFAVTVNVATGTYTAGLLVDRWIPNAGSVYFTGTTATINPGSTANPVRVIATIGSSLTLQGGLTFTVGANNPSLISHEGAGNLNFGSGVTFGQTNGVQIYALGGGAVINMLGSYTINGAAGVGIAAERGGVISTSFQTVTVTGTPAIGTFALAKVGGIIDAQSVTFSGSATGARYSAVLNGVINTNGGGATYFPGNSAGSTATGGQYA